MATANTFTKKQRRVREHSGAPYGNVWTNTYRFTTNSSGQPEDTDTDGAAFESGDTIRLGVIPAGTKLLDCITVISDAFSATATAKVGFAYVDGVDSAAVPQDDDYFVAALALSSTGIARKTTITPPVTLPKDAWLTLVGAAADQAAAGIVDITVIGQMVGAN